MYKKSSAPKKKPLGETKGKSGATLLIIEPRQDAVPEAQDVGELIAKLFDRTSTMEVSDGTITPELHRIHEAHYCNEDNAFEELRILLGVSDEVANIKELTPPDLVNLGGSGVRSIEDLAGLCTDELIAIVGSDVLTRDTAGNIIMAARKHWFEGDQNYT
jgi:N utilization substance protein A